MYIRINESMCRDWIRNISSCIAFLHVDHIAQRETPSLVNWSCDNESISPNNNFLHLIWSSHPCVQPSIHLIKPKRFLPYHIQEGNVSKNQSPHKTNMCLLLLTHGDKGITSRAR
jgi:hypothetical protein